MYAMKVYNLVNLRMFEASLSLVLYVVLLFNLLLSGRPKEPTLSCYPFLSFCVSVGYRLIGVEICSDCHTSLSSTQS